MASTPKQANGNSPSNNDRPGGKRKKSRSKGTFLSKWLDKTMRDIHEPPPSLEMYDPFMNSNMYPQFSPGFNPYKFNTYSCAPEPMSLPPLPTYYNSFIPPPYSDYPNSNTQQEMQGRKTLPRRRNENKVEEVASFPADNMNQKSYLELKHFSDSQDFASLPPIVTSMADTNSNCDFPERNDKEDSNNTRRFSDPCVRGLPDAERQANGDADSDCSSSGLSGSQVGSRLLTCLLDQIASLKATNGRLTKELQDTRAELDNLRQNGYFPKSSGNLGAPNLNSNGMYSPGCVADMVREIRDATRIREEAMYARLRAMLIEKTDSGLSSTESKLAERTLDEIKGSLRAWEADKRLMVDKILKLEDELRHLRLNGLDGETRVNGNDEDDRTRLRRELTETRRSKQNAEEHSHKLERLVTQLLSKFNGPQVTNGEDSLLSENENDIRPRRISSSNSAKSLTNLTNVLSNNNLSNTANTGFFGPVTDL
ncbi:uncharacterized protein LOC116773117 isoform X1 [Danaus plexippus]|uniref:uncharacterized protein LOC116773117 isoform X1 n=1 Tax=Danaus plexippus TaxID=13037 RepID=UPI002AB2B428|nr:uncharacterized protein LOC116773117 isoform X1 [Danaus plexippus]